MFSSIYLIAPYFAPSTTGTLVSGFWNTIYGVIKEIGTPLATATLVCSAFYFFIIGKDKNSLDKAKSLMIGSIVGLAIIYLAPTIINAVVSALSGGVTTTPTTP